jgi:hypothetical protein
MLFRSSIGMVAVARLVVPILTLATSASSADETQTLGLVGAKAYPSPTAAPLTDAIRSRESLRETGGAA